jgi:branched-chain amino acid transport system ATP-binding protein
MLELRQIDVRYGKRTSVSGLSLHVQAGEIVTLVGGNGAGKTTTLKAISGLQPVASGEIWFGGERIDTLVPHQILAKGLAHVPEGRMLFKDMSVLAHLELGSLRAPTDKAGFDDNLAWVYELFPVLKERSKQLAGTLSGGQQQMLAIARAIMSSPRLLLVDEPSVGLSPLLVSQTITKLKELKEQYQLTVLMAEQNFNQAMRIADYGYIIVHGEIVFHGDVATLKENELVKSYYLGV